MKGLVALALAALVVGTGLVTGGEVGEIWARTWPILAFLLLGTLLAEWSDRAGLFDRAAHLVARVGGGRRLLLFVWCCALALVVTITLGLDTTAVLLTPVLLALAASIEADARPFAFACLWLANAGSLLLPVSNLTNLLAQERLGLGAAGFVRLSWAPALATALAVVAYACVRWRHRLTGRYAPPASPEDDDPVLVGAAAVAVFGFAAGVLAGAPAWLAALGGCLLLGPALALRDRAGVTPRAIARSLPLDLAGFALGLFVVVRAATDRLDGLVTSATTHAWGTGTIAAVGAVAANLVDNLPAYLALEGLAGDPPAVMAVLVGVNAGPLVLPWGSLANLLWLQRCRGAGVQVRARDLAVEGLPVALLGVAAGALALAAST